MVLVDPAGVRRPAGRPMVRLAQVANFVGPASGGLRAVVASLGAEHVRDGGPRLAIVPGAVTSEQSTGTDRRVTLAGPVLPRSGGTHHVLLARAAVLDRLEAFAPDVLEIHDQTAMAGLGRWCRSAGVPTVLFAHERLDLAVRQLAGDPAGLVGDVLAAAVRRWLRRVLSRVDAVVCASRFAAEPFDALRATSADGGPGVTVHRIPFGVDLERFRPRPRVAEVSPWGQDAVRLIAVGRLYPEKAPAMALDVLARLRARGVPAELVLVGSGPLGAALHDRRVRERLPVHLLGHLTDPDRVAGLVAAADVALCLGPRETFGLAVLEAMAAGTPPVVHTRGAARELLIPGVGATAATSEQAAQAVAALAADPGAGERARARAEAFSWRNAHLRLDDLRWELRSHGRDPRRSGRPTSGGARGDTRIRL